jgi:drug/metabolite transporter (DMT)-like permease
MDGLLVLMLIAWGANYSLLKRAFEEVPPSVFNSLRMALASAVFLIAIGVARRQAGSQPSAVSGVFHTPNPLTRRDGWDLVWLGLVGHCMYQWCFVEGLARTTASNAALIFGTSPVVIALASAGLGRERIGPLHWAGAALSAVGIYFVVGRGASMGQATLTGDLLIAGGVICWTIYTLGGGRLMARHSPLYVTGMSMALGTVPYACAAAPAFFGVEWASVSTTAWLLLVPAALFALNFAYLVWYTAVQQLGPARTAIYSNAIPIVAMTVAAVWLGEPITIPNLIGAAAVLSGVVLTRIKRA